jgi:hypothetical protein
LSAISASTNSGAFSEEPSRLTAGASPGSHAPLS